MFPLESIVRLPEFRTPHSEAAAPDWTPSAGYVVASAATVAITPSRIVTGFKPKTLCRSRPGTAPRTAVAWAGHVFQIPRDAP